MTGLTKLACSQPGTTDATALSLSSCGVPAITHAITLKPNHWANGPETPQLTAVNGTSLALAAVQPHMGCRRKRTCEDNHTPLAGSWPQPQWPPNHESEAFEAVALKKSMILSPPEIYAEIAYHGRCQLTVNFQMLVGHQLSAGTQHQAVGSLVLVLHGVQHTPCTLPGHHTEAT